MSSSDELAALMAACRRYAETMGLQGEELDQATTALPTLIRGYFESLRYVRPIIYHKGEQDASTATD